MIHPLCQEFLHMVNRFLWSSGGIYFLFVLNICPWLGWNVLGLDFLWSFLLFHHFLVFVSVQDRPPPIFFLF